LFAPSFVLVDRVARAIEGLLAADRPFGIDLAREAAAALESVALHGGSQRWGARHTFAPVATAVGTAGDTAPDTRGVELGGDSDCVLATSSIPGVSDACFRGPAARYVWDLADRDQSLWVVPLGASGVPGDPHSADQLPLWASGRLVPVETRWDRLERESGSG
jgi:penicillin amidase